MKAKLLAVILVLGGLFAAVDEIYACGNQDPVAILKVRGYLICGRSALFDASESWDEDGEIVKYEWNFDFYGEGNYIEGRSKRLHTYSETGNYVAWLLVIDNRGGWDTRYRGINVSVDSDGDDGDDLPDGWEEHYFGDLSQDWDDNSDGDEFINLCEYLHGTNPDDDQDYPTSPSDNIIIRVPADASTIQRAIDAAIDGDEIWVTADTYKPTSGSDRSVSFEMADGVALYGGFAGTETRRNQRDWENNVTTLSGDISGDNSYHVVTGADNAVLDGFIIKNGVGDHASTAQYQCGGGMYNDGVSPTVINCTFTENQAYYGAGMSNDNSSPTVTNCRFVDNEAVYWGGGMENTTSSSPTITRCIFAGNAVTATDYGGGAIYCYSNSNADIVNCTISKNTAANGYAGGLYSDASSPTITNTIFWDNTDGDSDLDLAAAVSGTITINYSDVTLGYYDSGTGGVDYSNCISVDPLFADAASNDFHLKSASGRWNGSSWVTDENTSLCVAAGHPDSDYSNEPTPNGGRINMGVYGNTSEASKVNFGSLTVDFLNEPTGAQCRLIYNNEYYDGIWHDDGYEVQLRPGVYIVRLKPTYSSSSGLWHTADDYTVDIAPGASETVTVWNWYPAVWVSKARGNNSWDGGYDTPYKTIQYGIDNPKNVTGDVYNVVVEYDTYYEHNIDFPSDKDIKLKGISTVSGNKPIINGSGYRGFNIVYPASDGTLVANFVIVGCSATDGAGIYIRGCDPTIKNCTITGNGTASTNKGGGLYITLSNAIIQDCTFKNNHAQQSGGAIYTSFCQATFTGCDIGYTYNNFAPGSTSGSAEIYTSSTYVPTYTDCGIRGATYSNGKVYGSYCDYSNTPPIDGGGNY